MPKIKTVSFIVDPHQAGNRIFDFSPANPVNRDDGVYPFFLLKQSLANVGIEISTSDILPPEKADALLFLDLPKDMKSYDFHPLKFAILTESELIKPQNWELKNHLRMRKIFTWNDDYVDGHKYIKLNFSNRIQTTPAESQFREKFCCMIAGAKSSKHPLELYSKRVEAIRWFEKNHSDRFDLFGTGWDLYTFTGPKLLRALNRLPSLRKALAPHFPSYRGRVASKRETLQRYQFSICFENAEKIPGYITEKIFDAMFAGCIPVYWGAPNVSDSIPADCFIHKEDYSTYPELYEALNGISLQEIQTYQDNIKSFLLSPSIKPYTAEFFAATITQNIV